MIFLARSSDEIFVWVSLNYSTANYQVQIDGVDQVADVLNYDWETKIAPGIGSFKIVLNNNNQAYDGRYQAGDSVSFSFDFENGTTVRFTGYIEQIKDVFGEYGQTMEITGSHVTGLLLDRMVTAEFDGTTSSDQIIISLMNDFAPTGFNTNNVASCNVFPKISFNAVPLWKAICDVVEQTVNFDCYVDDQKSVHFFRQGSRPTDESAAVQGDNLLELEGLGKNILDIRNKVTVMGEQDGLPVIYTAEDEDSQTLNDVREKVIQSTDIKTEEEAASIAENILSGKKENLENGVVHTFLLPALLPGQTFFIVSDLPIIYGRFRAVRIKHTMYDFLSEIEVEDVR